jgi:hypothetical protein
MDRGLELVNHGAYFQFGFIESGFELVNEMPFFQSRLREGAAHEGRRWGRSKLPGRWFRGVLGFVITTMILRVGGGILSCCPRRRYGDE